MIKLPLAFAAAALLAADAPEMRFTGDHIVPATVHGIPARLRVDPGAPSLPVFNPEFATRAGFKAGWIGMGTRIGPILVKGSSAVVRIDLGQGEFKRRVTWFATDFVKGADGSVGPGAYPADILRFELRAPQPGETRTSFPLADFGLSGMGIWLDIGGERARVRFSTDRDRTTATAALGAAIAAGHSGAFDRPAETMPIFFGVERPVRHLALAKPLRVGPFALDALLVRTGDFGSTASIAEAGVTPPPADPDEIVVTGKKKKNKNRMVLEIGRDYLDRCSSIVFDKPAKTLTFSCR